MGKEDEIRQLLRALCERWKQDVRWETTDYGSVLPDLLANPRAEIDDWERDKICRLQELCPTAEARDALPALLREECDRLDHAIEVERQIEKALSNFQLKRAKRLYDDNCGLLDRGKYVRAREERILMKRGVVHRYILADEFSQAEAYLKEALEQLEDDEVVSEARWFDEAATVACERWLEEHVTPLLAACEFEKAAREFADFGSSIAEGTYSRLLQEHRVRCLLKGGRFAEALSVFSQGAGLTVEQYADIAAPFVASYFSEAGLDLDPHKARALGTPAQRTVVEARAGSGKTLFLACMVKLLVEKMGIACDEILVVAFNKRAAAKIGEEIRALGVADFRNARTFHSLACHIDPHRGQRAILFDPSQRGESDGAKREEPRSDLLAQILRETFHLHPLLWVKALAVLRKEAAPLEAGGSETSEEYRLFRRNESQKSLDGCDVRSSGEKYIADFLFEHGIPYNYEPIRVFEDSSGQARIYRPDFELYGRDPTINIEHWTIDPDDPRSEVPKWYAKSTAEYRREIDLKRAYWKRQRGCRLLETNNALLIGPHGRRGFEKHLAALLESSGVACTRLTDREIRRRLFEQENRESAWNRLVKALGSLISRAKHRGLGWQQVRELYQDRRLNRRTRIFGSVAWRVYRDYTSRVSGNLTDFDSVLQIARERIELERGAIEIEDRMRHVRFRLDQLKWVLVDELQDLMPLFHDLFQSMARHNPELKLVGVGDDWQAINRFAGSDTKYIMDFERQFPRGTHARFSIPVTRRCPEQIVKLGNEFMAWTGGTPATHLKRNAGGECRVVDIESQEWWVDLPRAGHERPPHPDDRFLVPARSGRGYDPLASRYLKFVAAEIERDPESDFAILTRTGRIGDTELDTFRDRLFTCLDSSVKRLRLQPRKDGKKPRLDVSTVHSYKGQQCDVTLLLRVVERQFPLLHPDSELLQPLGESSDDLLDDERRLYYVAISRSRRRIVLVTEGDRRSPFLGNV